jgi:hypothetical protein
MIKDYNFQRDEEMLLLTIEGLDKNNTDWFNNLVGYVISHGNGGSVKGWAYEDAFYQEFYEVLRDDVIKHSDTKPDSDITIKTPVNDLDVQAKCYKTGSTSGIQLATLSNTNLCERYEECILPDGDFDGQRFSEIIRDYRLPVDLLTTLDYTTKKATLYAFDFVALVNIPFSPVNIAIVIPANINRTIIVITNAINVIPLLFFIRFPPFHL